VVISTCVLPLDAESRDPVPTDERALRDAQLLRDLAQAPTPAAELGGTLLLRVQDVTHVSHRGGNTCADEGRTVRAACRPISGPSKPEIVRVVSP
jgi:hypothetical protein